MSNSGMHLHFSVKIHWKKNGVQHFTSTSTVDIIQFEYNDE